MASNEPEDPSKNSAETDEETVALRRKRLRRVSFVDREITSVHIFKRDEDYETPPNSSASKPRNTNNRGGAESENEVLGLFRGLADSEDSRELSCSSPEGEDGDDGMFLRPRGSPSSGGSTVGSATSNDEDNFFGPVSAHFIKPGRLSDSAASDENHDITMDSTAFSMHFQSLVRSESGDLKTPTGNHLSFEEKTPSQVILGSDAGSGMVLTKAKKLFPKSPLPVDKVSGGRDSNDMNLVGENPHKYDYGHLSPRLEALLAEGSKDLNAASTNDIIEARSSENDTSMSHQNGISPISERNHGDNEMHSVDGTYAYAEQVFSELAEVDCIPETAQCNQTIHGCTIAVKNSRSTELFFNCQEDKGSQEVPSGMGMRNVSGTPLDQICRGQHDLFTHQVSGTQHLTEHQLKDKSAKDRKQNLGLSVANSTRSLSYVTPSPKQHGSFLKRKIFKLAEGLSSIQKSQSRFELINTSSPASVLLDRIEKSKLMLSGYHSATATPSNSGRREFSRGLQDKHADVPNTNLEKELSNVDPKTSPHKNKINRDKDGFGILNHDVDTETLSKDVRSLNDVYAGIVQGNHAKFGTMVTSLLKQEEGHCLVAENSTEGRALIGSDSLSGDITFDCRNPKQAIDTPKKFVSPPINGSNVKVPLPTDYRELQRQDQCSKPVSICVAEEGDLIEGVSGGNYLTSVSDKLDSLLVESRLILTETNCSTGSAQLQKVDISGFQSPLKARDCPEIPSGNPVKDLQVPTHTICSSEEFPTEMMEIFYGTSASPSVNRSKCELLHVQENQTASSLQPTMSPSSLKKPTRSPSKKELQNTLDDGIMQLVAGEDIRSPEPNLNGFIDNDHNQGTSFSWTQISERDTENSTKLKRKGKDAGHSVKISGAQRSPKVCKTRKLVLELVPDHTDGDNNGNKSVEGSTKLMDWKDIPRKLSVETYHLLAPLADKLNSRSMGMLEDVLAHLKKIHLCQMLCSEIPSQKVYDQSNGVKIKRRAESRSLLCKLAYEKVKLHLLLLKQQRLLKRGQTLSSWIQESEMLRLNFARHLCLCGERDTQVIDDPHSASLVNPEQKNEVTTGKGSKKKQELEVLDAKIKNLTKSLHIYCKKKGEPNYSDTIMFLDDHLKKKMCCRLILQDMQLWEVDGLRSKDGNHDVVMNYSGFINQRLTVKTGHIPSLSISNKLNDTVIMKYFPNMDVWTAFASVFSIESTKNYISSKTLAQETQATSLLLCNLLDVVEELQLAQIELQNLVHASFYSPSAEQLYLQISFIDCRSSRKVVVTLDMACLTRGIYPAGIIPSKLLQAYVNGPESSLPELLFAEINSAIDKVGIGYPRIIKLCRCISQVFQS